MFVEAHESTIRRITTVIDIWLTLTANIMLLNALSHQCLRCREAHGDVKINTKLDIDDESEEFEWPSLCVNAETNVFVAIMGNGPSNKGVLWLS